MVPHAASRSRADCAPDFRPHSVCHGLRPRRGRRAGRNRPRAVRSRSNGWAGRTTAFTSPTGKVILTNPFTSNPDSPIKAEDVDKADLIVVADGHGDEVGSTVQIANQTGAMVLAPGGVNSWLIDQGVPRAQVPKAFFQPGDRYTGLEGITVRSVESVHGSELSPPTPAVPYGGVAAGYFITFENGFTVYFSGSSAAMAEQGLWAPMYKPNLAIVHMGADHEPIDFAQQVKLLKGENPNLTTVFPHHNRVSPPGGPDNRRAGAVGDRRDGRRPEGHPAAAQPGGDSAIVKSVIRALVCAASLSFVAWPTGGLAHTPESGQPADAAILAVAGRQVAWLNLEAPRDRPVSRLPPNANALEVTAQPDTSHVVVSVGSPFAGGGLRGADLLNLDLATGDTSPLLQRAEARESLNSPAWWPDRATLLFERQDLNGQPVGAPGQEVPRYPSRVERVMADGSGRGVLLDEGRQPSAAPDGTRLVYARTRNQGAALLIWSQLDGSVQTLVPEGRFADVAYPQFSPRSDQVAFVAPQSGLANRLDHARLGLDALFGPAVAYAHGIPWESVGDQRRRDWTAARRRDRRRRAVGGLVARPTPAFCLQWDGLVHRRSWWWRAHTSRLRQGLRPGGVVGGEYVSPGQPGTMRATCTIQMTGTTAWPRRRLVKNRSAQPHCACSRKRATTRRRCATSPRRSASTRAVSTATSSPKKTC